MIIPSSITASATLVWVKLVAVVVVCLALLGTGYHLGAKNVKADWDKEVAVQTKQRLAAEQAARAEENRRAEESRKVVDELAAREAASLDRALRAERSANSLRDTIAMLNSRPAPVDPEAARYADEARGARELLGSCSKEYTVLAAEADGLRDQVTGLQDWVRHVAQ